MIIFRLRNLYLRLVRAPTPKYHFQAPRKWKWLPRPHLPALKLSEAGVKAGAEVHTIIGEGAEVIIGFPTMDQTRELLMNKLECLSTAVSSVVTRLINTKILHANTLANN